MAGYDSPGFVSPIPGNPDYVASSTGAPGSASAQPDTDSVSGDLARGTVGYSAVVTVPGASLVNADRVQVSPVDASTGSQADMYGPSPDPMIGIGAALGETGAGMGAVRGPSHPNSVNGGQP